MNNKGFTLVELIATMVILSLVVGLGFGVFKFNMENAKVKTEEVFVDTLRDAVDVYLSSDVNGLNYNVFLCDRTFGKKHNPDTNMYEVNDVITFDDVINSYYKPLSISDFVNPANEDVSCNLDAKIKIYRDEDFVYYYYIDKSELGCLLNHSGKVKEEKSDGTKIYYDNFISNLPDGYSCR